jgi:hypothetical protein
MQRTRITLRTRNTTATLAAIVLTALIMPAAAHAQRAGSGSTPIVGSGIEIRPIVGAFIPTGDHRDLLKDAVLVSAELGWHFIPSLAVVGSFGWAPTKDKTTALPGNALFTRREEKVDLFDYDLGLEWRIPYAIPTTWAVRPYLGAGVGGRTYSYRDVNSSSQTDLLGYGKLGVDVAPDAGLLGVRFEARDNLTRFDGLRGELVDATTRNDVQLTAGLTLRF